MDLYAENILEHYRNPCNKVTDPDPSPDPKEGQIIHSESNPTCGDELTVHLTIEDNTVSSITWSGEGCAISLAAMSMLSEELEGEEVSAVLKLSKEDILQMLNVLISNRRLKCALLCLHVAKNALRKMAGEEPQGWVETVEVV